MKKGFLTTLLIFGVIFGAGNLIFPPTLGIQSGSEFIPAIAGFLLSDVVISIGGFILCATVIGGYQRFMDDTFAKWFTLPLMIALYLVLGPAFAIPRTAAVSYQMGIAPLFGSSSPVMVGFIAAYFLCAYWVAINPQSIMTSIGKILTPIFAILILILIIVGISHYGVETPTYIDTAYQNGKAFGTGFLEGYNTFGVAGVLPFSIVVLTTLKSFGFKNKKEYKLTLLSVYVFTALLFSLFYIGLAFLGNQYPMPKEVLEDSSVNLGVYILTQATATLFGEYGSIFLSVLVTLTCFTTAAGLLVAVSEYFHQTFPKLTYKTYVRLFTGISFAVATMGLNQIITVAVPILRIAGPIVITIMWLVVVNKLVPLSKKGMQLTVGLVSSISIISVLASVVNSDWLLRMIALMPLSEQAMEWVSVLVIGTILSLLLPNRSKLVAFDFEAWQSE